LKNARFSQADASFPTLCVGIKPTQPVDEKYYPANLKARQKMNLIRAVTDQLKRPCAEATVALGRELAA